MSHRSNALASSLLAALLLGCAATVEPPAPRATEPAASAASDRHEPPTRFFLKIRAWTLTFVKDGARIVRLDILDSGETVPGTRIDEDVPKG